MGRIAEAAAVAAENAANGGIDWVSNRMIALYIVLGMAIAALGVWLVMRRTVRTRTRTEREVRDDPDIHDWLVVFDWSRKILYLPTISVSLTAALVMFLHRGGWLPGESVPQMVGGAWFAVFLANFLVEEFEISIKVVLIGALCLGVLFLWLHLLGWVGTFLRIFTHLRIEVGPVAFLVISALGLVAIGVSWIRGLFYYVVFTPNYMNIQWGPTESGDHISREDYNTHVDTSDVLERLMGFGRLVIIFKDQKRPPITLLVWRIGKRAQYLEAVRGKFAIDMNAHAPTPDTESLPTSPEAPRE